MTQLDWLAGARTRRGDRWADWVEQFERENGTRQPGGVVFVGDSITAGFNLSSHFPGADAINRGIGGDRIAGVCERFDVSAPALEPKRLFLMIGINDILWDGPTVEQVTEMHRVLLELIATRLPETESFIQSILPIGAQYAPHAETILKCNEALATLASHFGHQSIDLHSRFVCANALIQPALTTDDLHLSREGYRVWANAIRPLVEG